MEKYLNMVTWFDRSSIWAFSAELLWLLFSVEPLFMPGFDAAVGGTRAVGGVTVLGVAFATTKCAISIWFQNSMGLCENCDRPQLQIK